jgi:hypothetical protein
MENGNAMKIISNGVRIVKNANSANNMVSFVRKAPAALEKGSAGSAQLAPARNISAPKFASPKSMTGTAQSGAKSAQASHGKASKSGGKVDVKA